MCWLSAHPCPISLASEHHFHLHSFQSWLIGLMGITFHVLQTRLLVSPNPNLLVLQMRKLRLTELKELARVMGINRQDSTLVSAQLVLKLPVNSFPDPSLALFKHRVASGIWLGCTILLNSLKAPRVRSPDFLLISQAGLESEDTSLVQKRWLGSW